MFRIYNSINHKYFSFLFYYPLMNISLRWMIYDHRTDNHVPGTSGHNSLGYKTLTRPLGQVSLSDASRASPCTSGFGVLSQSTVHVSKLPVLGTLFAYLYLQHPYHFHIYLLKLWLSFSTLLFYPPLR